MLVELGLHAAIVGALLAHFDVFVLGLPILAVFIATVYLAVFAGFCYAGRRLTTSRALVPLVAVKLQLKLAALLFAYVTRGFKPTFPAWTLAYELTIGMMRFMFMEYGQTIVDTNTHLMREPFAMHGRFILSSNCRKHKTMPEKLVANGMEHMWMVHYHGGGYCISDPLQDVELANQTHTMLKQILKDRYQLDVTVDVLLANYRKAPEFLYPTALNDCFDMYKYVLKHESVAPNHVVFSGDSAGAEMALTNCMRLRKESPELQPAAALCYSPMIDFSETDIDEKAPYCILVTDFADNCIATYLRSLTDPEQRRLASAISKNLRDLPPIFLQWGELERFYEQGLRFKATADAQGVTNMELDILKSMVHDSVMFPTAVSPAAEKGIRHACEFAANHLAPILRSRLDPEPEPQL